MCVVLFVWLPVEAAAIWSLLGGYLLLPSGASLDIPLLPPLDKSTIPAISTFLLCWMKGSQSPAPRPSLLVYVLASAFVLSAILSTFNNSYELQIGDRSIPGYYPLDGIKMAVHNVITLMPFFIGMRFLSSDRARALLLRALPVAALFYSLPMLFEVRFSPQLHRLVYGYTPASFVQQVRDSGYRPVVFMFNGLEVALFTSIALVAAVVVMRARWRVWRVPAGAAAAYLGVLLILCKTMGAMVYAAIAAPLALFTTPKTWVRVACAITLLVCAYPLLRTFDLVPVHHITAAANSVSADRAGSFEMRVDNEDKLLAKGNQKPFFGWGTWGRNRIYDKETGGDVTITDGAWIIEYGGFGWFGYLSLFGLFAASVFRARSRVRGPVTRETVAVGGMALMLAMNMIDLIPNANLVPLTFLMAGSVAGCVRSRSAARKGAPRPLAEPAQARPLPSEQAFPNAGFSA